MVAFVLCANVADKTTWTTWTTWTTLAFSTTCDLPTLDHPGTTSQHRGPAAHLLSRVSHIGPLPFALRNAEIRPKAMARLWQPGEFVTPTAVPTLPRPVFPQPELLAQGLS
jgi:hypothetical protein